MSAEGSDLYLDTSCLLKLFFDEPESESVAATLSEQRRVVVSELARLEAETQLRARLLGGLLTKAKYRRLVRELGRILTLEPFVLTAFPHDGCERALRLAGVLEVHCRTLGLLHVAAMEALGIRRLLTNDRAQGAVASALGASVITPRAAVTTRPAKQAPRKSTE